MKLSIPVVIRTQDNGDGGFTIYVYNNDEEMFADHPMVEGGELTKEEKNNILNEEDPYENGYIGRDTIEIELDVNTGVAKLEAPISFQAGQ